MGNNSLDELYISNKIIFATILFPCYNLLILWHFAWDRKFAHLFFMQEGFVFSIIGNQLIMNLHTLSQC